MSAHNVLHDIPDHIRRNCKSVCIFSRGIPEYIYCCCKSDRSFLRDILEYIHHLYSDIPVCSWRLCRIPKHMLMLLSSMTEHSVFCCIAENICFHNKGWKTGLRNRMCYYMYYSGLNKLWRLQFLFRSFHLK